MAVPKKSRAAKAAPDTTQVEAPVRETTTPQFANKETKNMTSIFEFQEDVATAEAPPALPKGDYPAEIRAAELALSKSSGKPMGVVQFFISADDYPADFSEGDPDGMVLTYYVTGVTDTGSGRFKMRKFLEAIGAKGGKTVDPADWVGNTAIVTVDHDDYEGETRAKISRVVAQ